jgi:large subunit ribosomal protein L37Ae
VRNFANTLGDLVARKKRVGPAARFGPRYGTKVRKRVLEIEQKMRRFHKCPKCGASKVKRVATAIWQCRRCGVKFAGAAYTPIHVPMKPAEAKAPEAPTPEGGEG